MLGNEQKIVYCETMNKEILEILLRVNADITLSEASKTTITQRLESCNSEEEFNAISRELEHYWWQVDPIIQNALNRKTPEELIGIEQNITRMITDTNKVAEKSTDKAEKNSAHLLLSDI